VNAISRSLFAPATHLAALRVGSWLAVDRQSEKSALALPHGHEMN
jgi:hypothetical protein